MPPQKTIIITLVAFLLLAAVASVPASAQTSANQALILQLQAKIAQLQAQLLALQGSKTTTSYKIPTTQECDSIKFSKPLYQGLVDGDVLCLQKLLNKDSDTKLSASGLGSLGNETIYFGFATKQAVIKFQKKYGISPIGLVGTKTRTKLNSLITPSKTEPEPEPEKELSEQERQNLIEEQAKTFAITVTQSSNGSISPGTTSLISRGAKQTFTITPSNGYSVSSVLVDGVSVGAVTSYTFNDITQNHSISATFTQEQTQPQTTRNLYQWIEMSDETQTMQPYVFRQTEMPRRYPFVKRHEVLFLNVHSIDIHYDDPNNFELDMVRARQSLDALNLTPGTYVGLDLEVVHTSSGVLKWRDYYPYDPNNPDDPNTFKPNIAEINAKAQIISTIKSWRPDCYFGYYFFPDSNQYWNTLGANFTGYPTDAQLDAIMQAAAPVINASDYIAPDFYWYYKPAPASNYFTAEKMASFVTKVIARTRKYYPDKKIIPYVMWVYNQDLTQEMKSPTYNWTAEEKAKVTVPGPDWRTFLNALSDNGVNDITGFLSIWMPWDNNAPWWVQTLDWLGEPNNPVAMSKKQDLSVFQNQLASISASIQNLLNYFKK
jgi:peptidoglycan hydrolase-like protein with peptidoglycan-binding domain